ncbi:CRISPR-associated exonuclease, Cas4 family [Clostridium sp. USBA 49]|uniref:CRISPR-associated protein Cas4 n=1 Tax=Clostridium sp. USBA 49 TaxID=1881060 RepID=UPI00099A7436|nr:CRISPR-associated protein Cas4 [Clostridium sp. USBA 49]SKA90379.1 CRISPR-associated exonuclease, Cas4 family [Clostridium sp. USBA 49]
MSLYQNLFNENEIYVTPSEIIEFMYCQRFAYFMNCLGIKQNEDKRYKVIKGRNIHIDKSNQNVNYVRKKINGVAKYINVYMISKNLGLKGIVDEIYELKDGSLAPLDYKYAVYEEKDFLTSKIQMGLYSLLIEDIYKYKVNKMFLIYCRSGNLLKELEFKDKDREAAKKAIDDYKKVIQGYYPKATKYKARCIDCCYRNICIK